MKQMLDFAVSRSENYVNKGCKGFFIMAEGSQVDWLAMQIILGI